MNRTGWIATAAIAISSFTPALAGAATITLSAPQIISGPITGAAVLANPKPSVWVAGDWWAPQANQAYNGTSFIGGSLPGDYVYRLTFDLTGFDPSTAVLQGGWATDNAGSIWLNGVLKGTSVSQGFGANNNFAFVGVGFVAGLNTLDFHVNNETYSGVDWDGPVYGENPTGFHVEFLGVNGLTATPSAVPEPATLTLLALGLVGAGLARARRKN